METLFFAFVFIFGTIIGSFLNVVVFRFNTGRGLGKRSFCPSCNHTLSPHELVPIASFIFQKGRCVKCSIPISIAYPLTEFTTGFLFLLLFQNTPLPHTFSDFFLLAYFLTSISLLIAISSYDIRHKIIPNQLVYGFIVLSFIKVLFFPEGTLVSNVCAGIFGATPFALIWIISKGRAMGLGDAKLMFGLGLMLGTPAIFSALLLAFWIGGAVSILLLAFSGRFTLKSELPFAPFLALASFLTLAYHINFFSFVW